MGRVEEAGPLLRSLEQKERVLLEARKMFADRIAPDFDPFDHLHRHETALSRHLGWLLDPTGSHAQGSLFLDLFLDQCRQQRADLPLPPKIKQCRVELEKLITCYGQSRGRIDIAVQADGLFLLIENKPVAGDGADQMRRYQDVVEASAAPCRLLVILRGYDDGSDGKVPPEALTLRLGFEVRDWIDAAAKEARAPDIRMYLRRFSDHLAKRFTGISGSEAMNAIIAQILESQDYLKQAVRVEEALPQLRFHVSHKLRDAAERNGPPNGIPIYRRPDDKELTEKWGTLRFDLGNDFFDLVIQSENNEFSRLAFGLLMREEKAGVPPSLDEYRRAIEAVWGETGKTSNMGGWLWWNFADALIPVSDRDDRTRFLWAANDLGPDGVLARALARAREAKDIFSRFR